MGKKKVGVKFSTPGIWNGDGGCCWRCQAKERGGERMRRPLERVVVVVVVVTRVGRRGGRRGGDGHGAAGDRVLLVGAGEVEPVRHVAVAHVEPVESHPGDPGLVPLAAGDHPFVEGRVDRDQVVLPAEHHVLPVGRPADAGGAAEVRPRDADELHSVVVEDPEVAILGGNGQEVAAGGEGELVDGSSPHCPLVERIS